MTERRPRRRPSPLPVMATALAAFLATLTFLGAQLRSGHDPALGAQVSAPAPAKRVLVRRVIKRKVVVTVKPAREADDGGASSAPAAAPQVSQSSSAPAAAPAPAAPAPAPPVATRSS